MRKIFSNLYDEGENEDTISSMSSKACPVESSRSVFSSVKSSLGWLWKMRKHTEGEQHL